MMHGIQQECQTGGLRAKSGPRSDILWPAQGFCSTVRVPDLPIELRKNCSYEEKRSSGYNCVKIASITVMRIFIFKKSSSRNY